jgi:histidine ammonia-lyase
VAAVHVEIAHQPAHGGNECGTGLRTARSYFQPQLLGSGIAHRAGSAHKSNHWVISGTQEVKPELNAGKYATFCQMEVHVIDGPFSQGLLVERSAPSGQLGEPDCHPPFVLDAHPDQAGRVAFGGNVRIESDLEVRLVERVELLDGNRELGQVGAEVRRDPIPKRAGLRVDGGRHLLEEAGDNATKPIGRHRLLVHRPIIRRPNATIGAVKAPPPIAISEKPMRMAELLEIAGGRRLELSKDALRIIGESRAVVEAVLASGQPVYGLNTGLGHTKDTRLTDEQIRTFQEGTVKAHAGAIGPDLPTGVVRAAMAVRVNGIARGGAGASMACVQTLVAMLNAGVHPIVPSAGSVGASDLAQMAAIAVVALGGGEAEFRRTTMSGSDALLKAGIPPLRLEPKDGLTMISNNGISVGHGAIVVSRAMAALELANFAATLSLEAMSGNISPFEPAVAAAKGGEGQAAVSDHCRGLMRGSRILEAGTARSIQDALSFRVVPQVHGALWEFVELAKQSVEGELNAMTDNPLVSRVEGRMISNGNFHPMVLALAFDALRPALAHVGQLSDRRMNHLWAASFSDPDVLAFAGPQLGIALRYAAAAESAELRQLAGPASLDCPPLDMGIEDHATGAPISVRRTDLALERLEAILAVEILMARDLLMSEQGTARVGVGSTALLESIDSVLGSVGEAASPGQVHAAVCAAMRDQVLTEVGRETDRLTWRN